MAGELRLRSDIAWRELSGRIVAMDVRTADCVAINHTGTRLWRALVEGATLDDLTAALVSAFRIDAQAARRDVELFVGSLRSRALLEPGRPQPPLNARPCWDRTGAGDLSRGV